MTLDDSADTDDSLALLTPTSLAGLDMGRFTEKINPGLDPETYNEIQTLRVDASGGTFDLQLDDLIGGMLMVFNVFGLAHDITAAALDAQLETMLLDYLNEVRVAANEFLDDLTPADVSGGLVEVALNDDVYVIRFVGLLSNYNMPQVTAAPLRSRPCSRHRGDARCAARSRDRVRFRRSGARSRCRPARTAGRAKAGRPLMNQLLLVIMLKPLSVNLSSHLANGNLSSL